MEERYEIIVEVHLSGFGSALQAEWAAGNLMEELVYEHGYSSSTTKRTVYDRVTGDDIREF